MRNGVQQNLFAKSLDTQLYPVSFPVFLELREILDALFRHPTLVNFVFVLSYSTTHLLEGLITTKSCTGPD